MAAGRGSRMKGYNGNKTLLPLIPGDSPYNGEHPILLHIIDRLPKGPKAVIVNFKKEDVFSLTKGLGITYCEQPRLNGTGGALLAAREFIEKSTCDYVIVTMGDVPFVKKETYTRLIHHLDNNSLAILGFVPDDKKQYGVLDISDDKVRRIIEWKYWSTYSSKTQAGFSVCNSGIYAFRKDDLVRYLPVLASRPQKIIKEIDGKKTEIEEFFITDIVEFMVKDNLSVGYVLAENEIEAMGVDDLGALERAQKLYGGKG
jgi:bifunctional UDP-N-acetylglucosamine pyrophosphorylase/glucosamine-1-phosphate N-acetyltransferase